MSAESQESAHSLDRTFIGGLAWTAGSKWLTQGLTWVSVLIVARLLSPGDFGLVEMAGSFFVIANVLAEFGIGAAVVQMRGLERDALGQLNTLSLLVAAVTFGIAWLCAPAIAAFFRAPEVETLVAVNSIVFFIIGFQTVPSGILRRNLDYRRISISEAVLSTVQAVITVIAAWLGMAYWALVIGQLCGRACSSLLLMFWARVPFRRPRFEVVRAPFRFGYHVSVANLSGAISAMSDAVVVGRRLGDALLGHYRMALTLAYAPIDKVGSLIMRVTGPLFARIQADHSLLRRYFLIFTESLTLTIVPMSVGIALVAPELVAVVLGAKWAESVGALRFLSLFCSIRLIAILMNQILFALNRTRFTMNLSLLALAVMPAAFWFAANWGLAAIGASWLLIAFINVLPSYLRMKKDIGLKNRDFLNALFPSLAGSLVMALGVQMLRSYLHTVDTQAWLKLLSASAAGAILYTGFLLLFFRGRFTRYISFARSLKSGRSPE
ncbi:MAG: lipopolysaccharide biosynthesis protein [Bryobacterales bacterium]|nr:lipopolysaccharide biosynthesis protein [Bryobacterales bacterium]